MNDGILYYMYYHLAVLGGDALVALNTLHLVVSSWNLVV